MQFVDTCPDWARSSLREFEQLEEALHGLEDPARRHDVKLVARRMAGDPSMVDAWRALDKARKRQEFDAGDLVWAAVEGLCQPDGLSASKRLTTGNALADAAASLAQLVQERGHQMDWNDLVLQRVSREIRVCVEPSGSALHPESLTVIDLGASELIVSMLTALAAGSREWATAPPMLARPERRDADRLHFIRTFARRVRDFVGQPSWPVVLAVSGLFFDCSNMDVNDVQRAAALPPISPEAQPF